MENIVLPQTRWNCNSYVDQTAGTNASDDVHHLRHPYGHSQKLATIRHSSASSHHPET
jgi:hypothetical protein